MGTNVARVSGLDELAQWIATASGRGADRFELWQKTRGSEQERVHVGTAREPFDLADELLAHVEGDRRLELGHVSYAVFAYRGEDKTPLERAFVSPATTRAVPMTLAVGGAAGDGHPQPSAALASVFTSIQQMTRDVFGSLQRENEHQRKTNEAMLRTSTGSFETFAKGYERTFGDLQTRLESSIKEGVELRAKCEALEREKRELEHTVEEFNKIDRQAIADAAREDRMHKSGLDLLKFAMPALLARLANKPMDTALLGSAWQAFLDSITDEQTPKLLATLSEPQQLFVIEVLKAHRASKKAATQAAKAGGASAGLADAAKAKGAPSAATPANDDGAMEREFERLAEIFVKHGDQFVAWMDRHANPGTQPEGPASR
jgi:hypothetical protein